MSVPSRPLIVGDVVKFGYQSHHYVAPADLEMGQHKPVLDAVCSREGVGPGLIFANPPWSSEDATMFREGLGEQDRPVDFWGSFIPALLDSFEYAASKSVGPVLCAIQFGKAGFGSLTDAVHDRFPDTRLGMWEGWIKCHDQTEVCRLLAFVVGADSLFIDHICRPTIDASERDVPGILIRSSGRRFVYDPCCGRGDTLVAAARAGVHSLGTDIRPNALSHAMARISAETGAAWEWGPSLEGLL